MFDVVLHIKLLGHVQMSGVVLHIKLLGHVQMFDVVLHIKLSGHVQMFDVVLHIKLSEFLIKRNICVFQRCITHIIYTRGSNHCYYSVITTRVIIYNLL